MSLRNIKQGLSNLKAINMEIAQSIEKKRKKRNAYDLFKDKIKFLNNNIDKASVYIYKKYEIAKESRIEEKVNQLEKELGEHEIKLKAALSSENASEYFEKERERTTNLKDQFEKSQSEYNEMLKGYDRLTAYEFKERFEAELEEYKEKVLLSFRLYNDEMDSWNSNKINDLKEIIEKRESIIKELKVQLENEEEKLYEDKGYFLLEEISIKEIKNTSKYGRLYIRTGNKVQTEGKDLEGASQEEIKEYTKNGWIEEFEGYYTKETTLECDTEEFITPWLVFENMRLNENIKFDLKKKRSSIEWVEDEATGYSFRISFHGIDTPIDMVDLSKKKN